MKLFDDYYTDDTLYFEDVQKEASNKKDNIIVTLYKEIVKMIQNVIDSFSIIIKKRASQEEMKNSNYSNYRVSKIEAMVYNTSKNTLDKGFILVEKILNGVDVPDEAVNEFLKSTRNRTESIKKEIKKNGLTKLFMSNQGYSRMKDLLSTTDTKIKENAQKIYNKETNVEKKHDRQLISLFSGIKSFVGMLNNV